MYQSSAPEALARHHVGLLGLLTRSEPEELIQDLVSQLAEQFDGSSVAALLLDPTGKHMTVVAAAAMPPWFSDLELPTDPESGPLARCLDSNELWPTESQGRRPHFLSGIELPIAVIAPIGLPGAHDTHGVLVVLSTDLVDIGTARTAAHLMALSIDARFDDLHRVTTSAEPDAGLPDVTQLLSYLDRVHAAKHATGFATLYRVAVSDGPYRAQPDGRFGRDDLARIGAILRQCVRPVDLVAHLGDADFAVVATDLGSENDVTALGIRLVEAIAGTTSDSDHPVGIYEATVGGTVIDGLTDAPTLLHDAAMARQSTVDRFGLLRNPSAASDDSNTRIPIEYDAATLVTAMSDGQIQPWYQPVFELNSITAVGVEALARWVRPDGRLVSPGEFLPAVEDHGLMSRLTATMLRQVIRDVSGWVSEDLLGPDFTASVNVSMSDLTEGMLPAVVRSLLDEYQLDAGRICLELTETEAMADVNHSLAMLHQLHDLGVSLAIDDFGTGYSSLSYLSRLPVDIVKIDRAFVVGLSTRRGDDAIIGAVVDVGKAVGLSVLAEGIETEEQLQRLRELGVELGQGFLVSPAIQRDALIEFLSADPAVL